MAALLLGPLLRYVGETCATVWVETDRPCAVAVLGHTARTFEVAGHHFALVVIPGLEPGNRYEYTVSLDSAAAWPEARSAFPPSIIRTVRPDASFKLVFGSCRVALPHEEPHLTASAARQRRLGVDSMEALSETLRRTPLETWPHLIFFAGDQVYADDVSPATAAFIAARRDVAQPPGRQVADFEEYTRLYREAWSHPAIRWLLSTVPTAMIFDDHDIHDDWNTSNEWRAMMAKTPWWSERIAGGLMAYWLYQHLGNLSPEELAGDVLYNRVNAPGDHQDELRAFAVEADREPESMRWSYRRDWGSVRLVVVDSRSSRVLTPGAREMLDPPEWDWLEEQVRGDVDHLLLGTSLPFLMPHAIHDIEAWDEAICDGAWGRAGRWVGERLRQAVDLEHWAAFQRSFERLSAMVIGVASGARGTAPATVIALSGDIHYAYVAKADLGQGHLRAGFFQVVCSPIRNRVERRILLLNKFAGSRAGQWLGGRLARATGVHGPLDWELTGGPFFGNEIATLEFTGRAARVRFDRPGKTRSGALGFRRVAQQDLTRP